MIKNYFVIAFRQLLKNKLYAAINVLGLVVGLAFFLFGVLLVAYERSHDTAWAHTDRIFTAGTLFGPAANIGVGETDGIYTAFAPFIDAEIEEVEEIARTVGREFLLSHENDHFYERVRFADPALTKIFDFTYIEGDDTALDDPSGVVLTRSMAEKFFGNESAQGKTLTLDHNVVLNVTAVIEDMPKNTHFSSSIIGSGELDVLAPLQALNRATEYDLAGNFNNLSSGDFTYMLLDPGKDRDWLQQSIDGVFDRHFPDDSREFIEGINVRPLVEANTILWDAVGLPILDSIRLLGFLVLIVAIVNYTNLATAQSLGRSREIGLRKTMGGSRTQLIAQFLVESLCVAAIAMVIALVLLALFVPVFNSAADKGLTIPYLSLAPWFVLTAVAVGLVAGAYPAYLITRASPIDALRDGNKRGGKGGIFRNLMLVVQFSISIFMLAMVMVMYLQNNKIAESAEIYPKSQLIILKRLNVESIRDKLDTLRNELMNVTGIENVTFSTLIPYEQSNSSFGVSPVRGDEDQSMLINQVLVDEHFLETYNIPLITGRNLDRSVGNDTVREGVSAANVIINELAAQQLGFGTAQEALGETFYDFADSREPRDYTIVGVMPDQNFQGFHNQIKPTVFFMMENSARLGSVRVEGIAMASALQAVEEVWDKLINDYPIQTDFLEDDFQESFEIYTGLSNILAGFAFVAMALSLIGLFGLAAFMAETRTKEIGVRKVMGASIPQIARLLIWQFSRPVMWALLFALPAAYFASDQFLSFFADRIAFPEGIVGIAGIASVVFAWVIVGIHAFRIARANPIHALRYE